MLSNFDLIRSKKIKTTQSKKKKKKSINKQQKNPKQIIHF